MCGCRSRTVHPARVGASPGLLSVAAVGPTSPGTLTLVLREVHTVKIQRFGAPAALALAGALALSACGGQAQSATGGSGTGAAALSGTISSDGSSTVGPLTSAAAELF